MGGIEHIHLGLLKKACVHIADYFILGFSSHLPSPLIAALQCDGAVNEMEDTRPGIFCSDERGESVCCIRWWKEDHLTVPFPFRIEFIVSRYPNPARSKKLGVG